MPAALRRAFGRRRRHGHGGGKKLFGMIPTSLGGKGGGLLEIAGVGTIGAVVLGNLLSLPWWMSPLGAAVFIWGWWQSNNVVRALGMFLIALGLMDALGVTKAISSGVTGAMAKGGGLFGGAKTSGGAQRSSSSSSSSFSQPEQALLTSALNEGLTKGIDEAFSSGSSDELSGDEFNA